MNSKEQRAVVLAVIALNNLRALPSWAKWIAQDANGHWYAYAEEPELQIRKRKWHRTRKAVYDNTKMMLLVVTAPSAKNWTKELYKL